MNTSRRIPANRGIIYDCNGEILANSSTVYTVNINPAKISENNKIIVAKALSDIFSLEYEDVLKKVNQNISTVSIAKKQPKETTDLLRNWMNQNNIFAGINIDEDTKRYYPYESLASHVIGFCGSDNQGLDGIEAKYEDVLKGVDGYIDRAQNAKGEDVGTNRGRTY